ncbi:MAG: hypothetical protein KAG43_06540 [Candidatus Marithrix sp.]|nr:hypothetical protein [Candidatus Marithrix sp.]
MRYLILILLSSSIFLSAYAGFVYSRLDILTAENIYLCSYIDKKIRLTNAKPTPKLVIVAGSNAYAGINAKMLEKELSIPTFNFGIHAGFGPEFLFYLAQQVLVSGDTVLLPLEYSMYAPNPPTDLLASIVFGCGKGFVQKTSIKETAQLLLSQPLTRLSNSFFAKRQLIETVFGSHGDATYNLEEQITEAMKTRVAQEIVGIEFYEGELTGAKAITKFLHWCRDNNIRVLATWPNMVYRPVYKEHIYVLNNLQKIRDFYQQNDVIILGEPHDSMFDVSYFYDTSYHLHQRGVKERTEKLLPLLRQAL